MARLGLRVVSLAIAVSSAAVAGSSLQISSAPRLATGTLARTGTTSWVSGSLERLRPKAGARATTGPLARRISTTPISNCHKPNTALRWRTCRVLTNGAYEPTKTRARNVNRPLYCPAGSGANSTDDPSLSAPSAKTNLHLYTPLVGGESHVSV